MNGIIHLSTMRTNLKEFDEILVYTLMIVQYLFLLHQSEMKALLHCRPKLPASLNHQITTLSQHHNIIKSSNDTTLK